MGIGESGHEIESIADLRQNYSERLFSFSALRNTLDWSILAESTGQLTNQVKHDKRWICHERRSVRTRSEHGKRDLQEVNA